MNKIIMTSILLISITCHAEHEQLIGPNIRSVTKEVKLVIEKIIDQYPIEGINASTSIRQIAKLARASNREIRNYIKKTFPDVEPFLISDLFQIQELAFFNVTGSNKRVLVKMFSPTCPACKAAKPAVKALAQAMEKELTVVLLNVDEFPHLAQQRLNVHKIPTFLYYKNGVYEARELGFESQKALEDDIKRNLGIAPPLPTTLGKGEPHEVSSDQIPG